MTRSPWYEALFAELVSDRKVQSVHKETTRTQSDIKTAHRQRSDDACLTSLNADCEAYDLAEHVQRRLHVRDPESSSQHVTVQQRTSLVDGSEQPRTGSSTYAPRQWSAGSPYITSNLASAPLYPQEVPQHRSFAYKRGGTAISPPRARSLQADTSRSHAAGLDGCYSPLKPSQFHNSHTTLPNLVPNPPSKSTPLQVLSTERARPAAYSLTSASIARPARVDLATGAARSNQCAGTTGAGKRCTRIVGRSKAPIYDPLPTKSNGNAAALPKQNGARELTQPMFLTAVALRQLDRRLSVTRRAHTNKKGSPKRTLLSHRDVEHDEDDSSYVDETHLGAEDDAYEELPVYCFQHSKQTLEQPGTFIGQYYVEFTAWIPPHLPRETQLHLRHEIIKPLSEDDIPGYIYIHEMGSQNLNTSTTTFIKLGRSIHPVARLSQWRSQCPTRQPIVRDIFPLHPSHPLRLDATSNSLKQHAISSPSRMHGALSFASEGAPNHRRWERLCLIELAGVAAMQAAQRGSVESAREHCQDCGKIHVEMFLVDKGAYEVEIRDLVQRWQRFVEKTASR